MSLTASDLQEIRNIVEQVVQPLQNEIKALRNDIKEIYDIIADLHRNSSDNEFGKLSLEQKILELNAKLVSAAKQAGISLPR